MLAASMLERMGHEADAVATGKAAIESLKARRYDAVLMDVWMPDMDGIEATAAIRALPGEVRDVPIIAMTADPGQDENQRWRKAGMNGYVAKPVDRNLLEETIRIVTGGSGAVASLPAAPAGGDTAETEDLVDKSVLVQLRIDTGPDLIVELLAAYIAETDERLDRMAVSIENGDLDSIEGDAHALKSSSGTFGARRLCSLATMIEAAAANGDADSAARLLSIFRELVERTWDAFAGYGVRPDNTRDR